jgi:hypothetical protein
MRGRLALIDPEWEEAVVVEAVLGGGRNPDDG